MLVINKTYNMVNSDKVKRKNKARERTWNGRGDVQGRLHEVGDIGIKIFIAVSIRYPPKQMVILSGFPRSFSTSESSKSQ